MVEITGVKVEITLAYKLDAKEPLTAEELSAEDERNIVLEGWREKTTVSGINNVADPEINVAIVVVGEPVVKVVVAADIKIAAADTDDAAVDVVAVNVDAEPGIVLLIATIVNVELVLAIFASNSIS